MATLEEAGVKFHTPASIQDFRECPALWVLRYLFGRKDFRSPAFARTLALNNGLRYAMHHNLVGAAEDVALQSYERVLFDWGIDRDRPDARSEHSNVLPMLEVVVKCFQAHGLFRRPMAAGMSSSTRVSDLSVPALSTPSFIYEDVQVHVHYTNKCPSKARPKDLMAMAIDQMVRKQIPQVVYITHKKPNWIVPEPDELTRAIVHFEEEARAIEVFMSGVESPEHALSMTPLNHDHYKWKPELLTTARRILIESRETIDGIIRAKIGGGLSEGAPRHSHWDLLSDHRSGDAEDIRQVRGKEPA